MYEDCFAKISEQRCGVLKVMLCRRRKCPFYKSQERYESDCIKYPNRNYAEYIKKGTMKAHE